MRAPFEGDSGWKEMRREFSLSRVKVEHLTGLEGIWNFDRVVGKVVIPGNRRSRDVFACISLLSVLLSGEDLLI
jgi:hypothetical protein